MLSQSQKKELLLLVRTTIQTFFETGTLNYQLSDEALFQEAHGAFVTLKKNGQLRGCIGYMDPQENLYRVIQSLAIQSSFKDHRFPPLQSSELTDITIEISVLTPKKTISSTDEICVGVHGLVLEHTQGSSVFLPHVPVEQGWSLSEYLEQLSLKAGLDKSAWVQAQLSTFEAIVFSDHD